MRVYYVRVPGQCSHGASLLHLEGDSFLMHAGGAFLTLRVPEDVMYGRTVDTLHVSHWWKDTPGLCVVFRQDGLVQATCSQSDKTSVGVRDVYFSTDDDYIFVTDTRAEYTVPSHVTDVVAPTIWTSSNYNEEPRWLWSIDGEELMWTDPRPVVTYCDAFGMLGDAYGTDVLHIAVTGVPVVPWGTGWLTAVTLCVDTEAAMACTETLVTRPLKIYLTNVTCPPKLICFVVLVRFDASQSVTHVSHAFLPEGFASVAPTGLHVRPSNLAALIALHAPDCRDTPLMALTNTDVHRYMIPTFDFTPSNFGFVTMPPTNPKPKRIAVLGYYRRHNTGDDCFQYVFEMWQRRHYPHCTLSFFNPYDIGKLPKDIDIVIIGGGDLINAYFVDRIRTLLLTVGPVIVSMVSVGTPYVNAIPGDDYLDFAHHVCTRNMHDIDLLSRRSPNATVMFFPDMVHALRTPRIEHPLLRRLDAIARPLVGFCLTRTIYHASHAPEYFNMVCKYAELIQQLVLFQGVHVVLLPFGINMRNAKENDVKLHYQIMALVSPAVASHVTNITPQSVGHNFANIATYITFVDNLVPRFDFAVCARFHAHVLCMNHRVPFMSVSTTRKVTELLLQYNLTECQYLMQLSQLNAPIDFDVDHFATAIKNAMSPDYAARLRADLKRLMRRVDDHIPHFVSYLETMLA